MYGDFMSLYAIDDILMVYMVKLCCSDVDIRKIRATFSERIE
jgi:hypothetical protein